MICHEIIQITHSLGGISFNNEIKKYPNNKKKSENRQADSNVFSIKNFNVNNKIKSKNKNNFLQKSTSI